MNNTTHTPGPWTWGDDDGPGCSYWDSYGLMGPGGAQIIWADQNHCPDQFDDGKEFLSFARQADAHLIAAAPDLLTACEALMHEYCGGGERRMTDAVVMGIARAAIAKAKGETP